MMTGAVVGPNYASIAGFYSQLAGVLAGFAFAGLVALIATQFTKDSHATSASQSFVPLISAFIGLVGTSLDYAIIAGDGNGDTRATFLETVGGLAFSVAGVMLLYSLLVLLHGAQADAAAQSGAVSPAASTAVAFTRRSLVFGAAPATIVILWGGLADQAAGRSNKHLVVHPLDYASMSFATVVLAFAVYRSRKIRGLTAANTPPSPVGLSASAVVIALGCAATITTFGVWASPDKVGSVAVRVAEMLVLAAFDFAIIQSATKYR